MKYPISIALLLLASLPSIAQRPPRLVALSSVTINLRNTFGLSFQQGAFNHFEVIDERSDTARIGIHLYVPTFGANYARQLVFHHSASVELADYLNVHFANPRARYSALIILRNLWLSDANYLREDMIKDPHKLHERTHIRLKAEIYATRDSLFMPVLRYDTVQVYSQSNRYTGESYYSSWDYNLARMLNNMADSASLVVLSKEGHSRLVSRDDIRRFNQSRFTSPISVAAMPAVGVYTSFDEFRNNAPSIRNFEIKMEHGDRLLYIKEPDGKTYYSHDAWGYCDGKEIFVMRDGVLCRAWREGNAFYFVGGADQEIVVPPFFVGIGKSGIPDPETGQAHNPSNLTNSGQSIDAKVRTVFLIDMDSGDMY